MDEKHEARTWPELLGLLTESPRERNRIAREVGVQPVTLIRWVKQTAKPREENMRALLSAIPHDYYHVFARLSMADFPGLVIEHRKGVLVTPDPPPEFYMRVLRAYAHTPSALYPHALHDLILQQIIVHLDPERQGMAVRIVRCVPPLPGKKVRSLLQIEGIGTGPWQRDLGQQMIFLGAESLAGAAATHSRLMVVNSRDEHTLSPIHWEEHEQSVAAAPILWKTKIAGCLLISSIQPHIFSETYLSLVEIYAYLMALAFERETFFDHQEIKLALMPLYTDQPRFLKHFSQRVYQKMNESAIEHQPITFSAAQERVCQEVEGEMLRFLSARSK